MALLPAPPRRLPTASVEEGSSPAEVLELISQDGVSGALEYGALGLAFYVDHRVRCAEEGCEETAIFRLGDAPPGTPPSWTDRSISNYFESVAFSCAAHLGARIEHYFSTYSSHAAFRPSNDPDRYRVRDDARPVVVEVVCWPSRKSVE